MSENRIARAAGRAGVIAALAGAVTLLGSGVASAHVTAKVLGEPAEQGGYTKITFRVPNEDDTAGTVKLEVHLPKEHPIAGVRTKPQPGWTAKITMATLDEPITSHGEEITEVPSVITWTAERGVRIDPGEFGEFELAVGPLPENTDQLVMPAFQTYDNGEVVRWEQQPPAAGEEEPERPAPVLELSPASGDGHGGDAAASTESDNDQPSGSSQAAAENASDDTARWLAGAGLAVGALGLGVGADALVGARRAGRRGEST